MEQLAKFLNQRPHCRLLDVGTGVGNFVGLIKQLYLEYDEIVGIDTSAFAIKRAKENFLDSKNVRFLVMDALHMDFDDESFDLVCLSNSLHHLGDKEIIFREMERVLKPGGYILISEMIANDLDERQMSHLKMHHLAAEIDQYMGETHNLTYRDLEIVDILSYHSTCEVIDYWPLTYERRQENSDEEIKWLFNTIDRVVERVTDLEKKHEFMEKAKKIKSYINEYGFDTATTLIVVMKK